MVAAFLVADLQGAVAAEADRLQLGRVVPPPQGGLDLCSRIPEICAAGPTAGVSPDHIWKRISDVNGAVNKGYPERSDQDLHRREDFWKPIDAAGGDCEDYALRKKLELLVLGVAPEKLRIVTVLDRKMAGHVVLLVQTAQSDMVLDNLTDEILPWRETGYVFLRAEDGKVPGQWRMAVGPASLEDL